MSAVNPPVDYADPCAALERLRNAYYALLEGRAAYQTEFEVGGGSRRRVTFHQTDLAEVRKELRRLETLCAAKQGGTPIQRVKFSTSKGT